MSPLVIATIVYFLVVFAVFMFRGKQFLALPLWIKGLIMTPLMAGMFYTVWWMQNEETKREATLMDVCWDAEGVAHYPETQEQKDACPGGAQPLSWVERHKSVYWDLSPEFDVYREGHFTAMKWWNKELGWDQFVESETKGMADIVIVHGSVNEGRGAMSTSHTKSATGIKAVIVVKVPGNIRQWMLEEEHELGHALGLAHDRSGIMKKDLSEGEKMKVWLLHDKDRDAIRSLYSASSGDTSLSTSTDASAPSPTPPTP